MIKAITDFFKRLNLVEKAKSMYASTVDAVSKGYSAVVNSVSSAYTAVTNYVTKAYQTAMAYIKGMGFKQKMLVATSVLGVLAMAVGYFYNRMNQGFIGPVKPTVSPLSTASDFAKKFFSTSEKPTSAPTAAPQARAARTKMSDNNGRAQSNIFGSRRTRR